MIPRDTMIKVIEKPDWVSWDDIHNVLWKAHEDNRRRGVQMRFPALPGEDIKKRLENDNGRMFVAIDGQKIVGTAAVKIKNANLWCGKGEFAYMCFASVLPEYSGRGIYKQLYEYRELECRKRGLYRIMFDTNENNTKVIDINIKNGYKKVSYRKYDDHFNIVFVKWLDGCPYSDSRCSFEFFKQKTTVKTKQFVKSFFKKKS